MQTDNPKLSNTHKYRTLTFPDFHVREYKLARMYNTIFYRSMCKGQKKLNNFLLKVLKCSVKERAKGDIAETL